MKFSISIISFLITTIVYCEVLSPDTTYITKGDKTLISYNKGLGKSEIPRSFIHFTPLGKDQSKCAITIFLKDSVLISVSTRHIDEKYQFTIDDFTRNGKPDIIQFIDSSDNTIIEAFFILDGLPLEIPKELYAEDNKEFYFDEHIIEYLKSSGKKH